jgi:hypothetical protein
MAPDTVTTSTLVTGVSELLEVAGTGATVVLLDDVVE